jgi:serralysin
LKVEKEGKSMCLFCGVTCGSGLTADNGIPDFGQDPSNLAATIFEMGDALATSATKYQIKLGQSFDGFLSDENDSDWIRVDVVTGDTVTFTLQRENSDAAFDLKLYDEDGEQLDFSVSSSHGAVEISFEPASSGAVFVEIANTHAGDGGSYTVSSAAAPLQTFSATEISQQLTDSYWNSNGGNRHAFNVGSSGNISVDITNLNADGQQLAKAALEVWEKYSGLNFVYTSLGTGADIRFDDENSGAYAGYSAWGGTTSSTYVNVSKSWISSYGVRLDSYSFQTYLHEIGHALGLGHAGNYNGSASYKSDGSGSNHYLNDSWQMSIMSYFSQYENSTVDATYAYVISPMIGDILAIQDLYSSVDASFNSGKTVYDLNGQNTPESYTDLAVTNRATVMTIFDTGGYDKFNFRATNADQMIDLRSGNHSDVGGQKGNLSIAVGTVIEKAISGGGDDTLIGNNSNNVLKGGGGADDLFGNGGDDKLKGKDGEDSLKGGAGNDKLRGGNDDDILNGGAGNDKLVGGGGYDRFDFSWGSGTDKIKKFENGKDKLLFNGTSADAFSDLTIKSTSRGAEVSVDNIKILLKGIDADLLDASDFLFA